MPFIRRRQHDPGLVSKQRAYNQTYENSKENTEQTTDQEVLCKVTFLHVIPSNDPFCRDNQDNGLEGPSKRQGE